MKILRVSSLGYEGGGADNGIVLLQPVLAQMGHEVKIMTSDERPELPHFSDYEFKSPRHTPLLLKAFYQGFYPASYRALKKVLKDFQPDIVQLHTMSMVSPSVLFLLRKYPTVMTVHGAEDFTSDLLLWAFPRAYFKRDGFSKSDLNFTGLLHYWYHRIVSRAVYRQGMKNVDVVVAFSRFMQRELLKDGIESLCISNATRLFEAAPLDPISYTLLYVGRLEKSKGIEYLIEAMPKILAHCPLTTLTIAGAGEYGETLKQLVALHDLQTHVMFLGHKNRDELYELYKKSALVVVPSVWPEPFGKVGIEAMSVGRPVIASDVGGISEWLDHGETGFLVPAADSAQIANRAVQLLSDSALRRQMATRAAARAQVFSIEQHAQRMIALYQSIIDSYARETNAASNSSQ
jgi:glycosyltransferase involved in cell wall biosynthesis